MGERNPQRKSLFEWVFVGQKAKLNPPRLDDKTLKTYAGVYGERKVTLENNVLHYQRTGPKYRIDPLTETLFAVEGLDYFRVEFVAKAGQAIKLIGHYDNGDRDSSLRTK